MALGTRRTPERETPLYSGVLMQKMTATAIIASTGTGVVTLTAAQMMQGILPVDCQDDQEIDVPTATALVTAIPGCAVGSTVDLHILNYGDSIITVGVNTGVTQTTIATVAGLLTIAAKAGKRIRLICTGVKGQAGATSNSFVLWAFGSTAAVAA